jgi:hypothetical protein
MVDLKGKIALVTGATSGIGQVTAEYLAGVVWLIAVCTQWSFAQVDFISTSAAPAQQGLQQLQCRHTWFMLEGAVLISQAYIQVQAIVLTIMLSCTLQSMVLRSFWESGTQMQEASWPRRSCKHAQAAAKPYWTAGHQQMHALW